MGWWFDRRRGALAGAAIALVALALLARERWWWWRSFRLAPRIEIEEAVADLSATLERSAVAEENLQAPVRIGGLTPSEKSNVNGGYHRAIIAVPPSLLRFRLRVPARAFLRFSLAMDEEERRQPDAAGVRFTVHVDGRPAYARAVNPAARRADRGWLAGELDLGAFADREVEIALGTEAAGAGSLAGTPGWSHVRLVRTATRERQAPSRGNPNVLLLVVDTLRADSVGCYGAKPSPTPNLDRLATTGLRFAHAVSQSSWTMPSVASILTGLHPGSHGVWGERPDVDQRDANFLPDALTTLPEEAQLAGITTAAVSGNPLISRGTNFAQGFETFVEFGLERKFGGADRRRHHVPAAEINDTFLRWLRANRTHRFLGYLHYMEPHDPYTPSPARRPPAPADLDPDLAAGLIYPVAQRINLHGAPPLPASQVAYLRQLYDAEVADWDAELERLLAGLAALGVLDSTVIVMTADHGEEFQEHGHLTHGVQLYEESIRVPLILAGGDIAHGEVLDQAQGIDIFPTVATLLGLTVPPGLLGQNLLGERTPRPALSELGGGGSELVSLRTSGWKLIHASAVERYELYDLARDPQERDNRFDRDPASAALVALVRELRAALPPAPLAEDHDPRLREKLRALGYVE